MLAPFDQRLTCRQAEKIHYVLFHAQSFKALHAPRRYKSKQPNQPRYPETFRIIAKISSHNFAFFKLFLPPHPPLDCTEVWDRSFHFQIPVWTRRFGFCGTAVGSDEKEWVGFRKAKSLFDERLEWEAATIYPLSWFPFQAWLAIKTLQTAWNWSLTLSDLVTSNPGSEMFLLQSVHTHCISSQREDRVAALCWAVTVYLLQIHRDSSSSLGKLIMQSYHQQIDNVSLTGATPVHMLLEMGLDKMRKDYINYLIGTKWLDCDFFYIYFHVEF